MARITVEDCIDKFPSRFELVLVASNRARKLHSGENPTIDKDNDKNTVIALREIAQETLSTDQLKNDLISEYQTTTFSEDDDLIESDENNDEDGTIKDQEQPINEMQVDKTQIDGNDVFLQNENTDDSEPNVLSDDNEKNHEETFIENTTDQDK